MDRDHRFRMLAYAFESLADAVQLSLAMPCDDDSCNCTNEIPGTPVDVPCKSASFLYMTYPFLFAHGTNRPLHKYIAAAHMAANSRSKTAVKADKPRGCSAGRRTP